MNLLIDPLYSAASKEEIEYSNHAGCLRERATIRFKILLNPADLLRVKESGAADLCVRPVVEFLKDRIKFVVRCGWVPRHLFKVVNQV